MAKELNKVPLPGAVVRFNDLELVAERAAGRRHNIQTVLVSRLSDADLQPAVGDSPDAAASETSEEQS